MSLVRCIQEEAELEEQRGEANQARKSAPRTVVVDSPSKSVAKCWSVLSSLSCTKEAMPDQRQRGIWGVQHLGGAQHACQQEQPKARLSSHPTPRCMASVVCMQQASHERHATHSHVSCGRHHRAKILLTLLSSLLTIQPGTEADRCPWMQQRAQELQIQEATDALCQSGKAVGDDVVSVTEADEQEQAERFQCHNHTTETALFQTLGHANA